MSDQNPDREKLAELIENARTPMGGTLLGSREQFEAVADAILASDWLAAHDREVAAKALEDAAAVLDQPYTLWWEATGGVKVREHGYDDISRGVELIEWFRARAACIREGNTE